MNDLLENGIKNRMRYAKRRSSEVRALKVKKYRQRIPFKEDIKQILYNTDDIIDNEIILLKIQAGYLENGSWFLENPTPSQSNLIKKLSRSQELTEQIQRLALEQINQIQSGAYTSIKAVISEAQEQVQQLIAQGLTQSQVQQQVKQIQAQGEQVIKKEIKAQKQQQIARFQIQAQQSIAKAQARVSTIIKEFQDEALAEALPQEEKGANVNTEVYLTLSELKVLANYYRKLSFFKEFNNEENYYKKNDMFPVIVCVNEVNNYLSDLDPNDSRVSIINILQEIPIQKQEIIKIIQIMLAQAQTQEQIIQIQTQEQQQILQIISQAQGQIAQAQLQEQSQSSEGKAPMDVEGPTPMDDVDVEGPTPMDDVDVEGKAPMDVEGGGKKNKSKKLRKRNKKTKKKLLRKALTKKIKRSF